MSGLTRQHARIDAQLLQGPLVFGAGIGAEDQLGIGRAVQPAIALHLGLELTGRPAGVTERGFVLHSADFFIENSTLPIDDGICLTATIDILKAIARGDGPASAILALGYAGWAPGQLENEMQANGWLHCAADPELIFGDVETKYDRALKKIGIDLGMLSNEAGHA